MNNNNVQKTTIRWRRFSGAHYAAFQSLHREVQIGVLTVAMLSTAGLKAESHSPVEVKLPASDTLREQLLEDVEVLATRASLTAEQTPRLVTVLQASDIAAAAVHSINDLLEYAVGIDVRQRGEYGVQTDIAVRGGNFDQVTLLLNGVNISSPHTGHLTADFPVTVQDIVRVEVLEGPAARVFGTSAFTGVVNIVTRQSEHEGVGGRAHLYAGSYGYAGADASIDSKSQVSDYELQHLLSAGYSRSDGATPNSDFGSTRLYYNGSLQGRNQKLNAQLGYSYKDYGANTFYGAGSTDQWESNEKLLGALTYDLYFGHISTPSHPHISTPSHPWHFTASANWNRWFDHYQWHRGTNVYGNFHRVDAAAAHLGLEYRTAHTRTNLSYEARYEGIYSTKLGEALASADYLATGGHDANDTVRYTHHGDRVNHNVFLEHNLLWDQWTVSLGLLANRNTGLDHRWRLYPGIDVSYRPTSGLKLFASWNMALRMPTYTDLYYSGANIIGNQDLKPERTNDVSLGARYLRSGLRAELQAFYSHKSDMIDWVIFASEPDGKTFRSTNFKLNSAGIETNVAWLPDELWPGCPVHKVGLQWAYLDQQSTYPSPILSSKYAMMYLRHKVVAQIETRIVSHLNLAANWRWMDRTGQNNPAYSLLDARLSWDASRWSLYLDATNLLGHRYYEYEYILQPGRLFCGGFKYKF